MEQYQQAFIEFCIQHQALHFGEFKLKSGRISPYFFNAGCFNTGNALSQIGQFYAQAIQANQLPFDMLFGPAYKGIPLVCATAIALSEHQPTPYAFNRKESKAHGEGGDIVGSPLKGKVLLIDDVITAGTAIRSSLGYFDNNDAQLSAIMIMLDRQERGQGEHSAIQELSQSLQIPVVSIINLDNILTYLQHNETQENLLEKIQNYREKYGT